MNGEFRKCDNKIGVPVSIKVNVLGNLQAPGKETVINGRQEASGRGEFIVGKICGVRKHRGETQYLVKWEGYGEEDNSWLDENRLNCPKLIDDFNRQSNLV